MSQVDDKAKNAEYQREYRQRNLEKIRKYQKEYHREYRKTYNWAALNGERYRKLVSEWKKNNPERIRLYRASRRAALLGARVEKRINKKNIHNWESRICGICNRQIENHFHIDHIIPLSRGGSHTVTKLQLAHPYCNRSKFTKLPSEVLMLQ